MFNFENLDVYKKGLNLSIQLTKLASNFPIKLQRLQSQLIGSAISIPLNIAEGSGRFNAKEKIQYYRMAQASAFELIPILEICEAMDLLKKDEWVLDIENICKMLSALIKNRLLSKIPNNETRKTNN